MLEALISIHDAAKASLQLCADPGDHSEMVTTLLQLLGAGAAPSAQQAKEVLLDPLRVS